jgi:NSS family neurotransmitter:Na+ symporter
MLQGGGERDSFGSKFGVIAAAAGSAIGLGNIWRFPYVVGQNGGGAFLLIYLFFIAAIGIPVMMSEFVIGRSAQLNPVGAFKKIAPGKKWHLIGLLGVVTAFIILAFYTVVAGWTLEYLLQSVKWMITADKIGFSEMDNEAVRSFFSNHYDSFVEGIWRPVIWFVVMMFFTGYIVISGVKNGIEKYAKILMPILLVLLLILVVRSISLEGAREGLVFLFNPDFSTIKEAPLKIVIEALGQAFFSLSIGMGTLITYGSYIQKKENLANTAVSVAFADTFIAVVAGLAIFPAVFAFGIDPGEGPELVYITLPVIFQSMSGGLIWAFMFFSAALLRGHYLYHLRAGGHRGLLLGATQYDPKESHHPGHDLGGILGNSLLNVVQKYSAYLTDRLTCFCPWGDSLSSCLSDGSWPREPPRESFPAMANTAPGTTASSCSW